MGFSTSVSCCSNPLPDEPVVIPLGLMKYSPTKFFSAYFLGKLTIAITGAFIGQEASKLFSGWFTLNKYL